MASARKSARAQADRFGRYPSGTGSIARTANPTLADTRPVRETTTCQADVAKAVGRYVARRPRYSAARAIALDRAFATFCTPE